MQQVARPSATWTPSAKFGRYRALLSRRRPIRMVAALAAAALVYVTLQNSNARVDALSAEWTSEQQALVLTTEVLAGEPIPPTAVELQPVPNGLRPRDSVDRLPNGARARVTLEQGEILRAARIINGTATETAARLPDGSRGVAFPADQSPGLAVGAIVDLYSVLDGQAVAVAATVVRVDEQGSTIAVDASRVGAVVDAIATGGVVVALVG